MTPAELLASAVEVGGRPDGSIVLGGTYLRGTDSTTTSTVWTSADASEQARLGRAYLERLLADQQGAAAAEALLRRLAEEKAEAAAAAERERRDPLHTLEAPLMPEADDDVVYLFRLQSWPIGLEFRRPSDGKRYRYTTPRPALGNVRSEQPEVACIPAKDAEAIAAAHDMHGVGTGAEFDDLTTMVQRWHAPRHTNRLARDYYPASDWVLAIVRSPDESMMPVIARWGRYARANQLELEHAIRQHLSTHGRLELMISFEELDQPSPFPAGLTKHYPPDPLPQNTMATREWAQRGTR